MSEFTQAGTETGRADGSIGRTNRTSGTGNVSGTGGVSGTSGVNRSNGMNAMNGANGREAYSFACMNCGYGWEQTYEIEHHTDPAGSPYVTYLAEGRKVPSPLTRPTCGNCDGHHVRIMRPGRVSDAVAAKWSQEHHERGVHRTRHWPTLHFLRRKPRERRETRDEGSRPGRPTSP